MPRELSPLGGWKDFPHAERLEEVVWSALLLTDHGGPWCYYNFTSTSSIWDSDTPERNWLSLTRRHSAEGPPVIEELLVELTPSAHPCHAQLEALLQRLQDEFGVRAV
jgi:hypothetical protein